MELPEVEIVCRQMRKVMLGKQITSAWGHSSKRFLPAKKSVGHTIQEIDRHGKYIIVKMQGHGKKQAHGKIQKPYELICHLGMSGSLSLRKVTPADLTATPTTLAKKYIRARWFFSDEIMELRDVRRFGWVFWVRAGDYLKIPTLRDAGPDALKPDFTPEVLYETTKKSRQNIKAQLMGQKCVAGLGNIYVDEALWESGISPLRTQLTKQKAVALHNTIVKSLKTGLRHGGTTLRDYRTFTGTKGTHQNHLSCYGRGGEPCLKCKKPLTQIKIGGRGTTYCKTCQK